MSTAGAGQGVKKTQLDAGGDRAGGQGFRGEGGYRTEKGEQWGRGMCVGGPWSMRAPQHTLWQQKYAVGCRPVPCLCAPGM